MEWQACARNKRGFSLPSLYHSSFFRSSTLCGIAWNRELPSLFRGFLSVASLALFAPPHYPLCRLFLRWRIDRIERVAHWRQQLPETITNHGGVSHLQLLAASVHLDRTLIIQFLHTLWDAQSPFASVTYIGRLLFHKVFSVSTDRSALFASLSVGFPSLQTIQFGESVFADCNSVFMKGTNHVWLLSRSCFAT